MNRTIHKDVYILYIPEREIRVFELLVQAVTPNVSDIKVNSDRKVKTLSNIVNNVVRKEINARIHSPMWVMCQRLTPHYKVNHNYKDNIFVASDDAHTIH